MVRQHLEPKMPLPTLVTPFQAKDGLTIVGKPGFEGKGAITNVGNGAFAFACSS
jgi:hypothetical protein